MCVYVYTHTYTHIPLYISQSLILQASLIQTKLIQSHSYSCLEFEICSISS